MTQQMLSNQHLDAFHEGLIREEKSAATVEKYLRDARMFLSYVAGRGVTKECVVKYKQFLQEKGYAIRSINSMLTSINRLMDFLGWTECKVKILRTQRQIFCQEREELTKAEYLRLLEACKHREQLHLVLQTICGTGIRVSELQYFNVEAIVRGEVTVRCKKNPNDSRSG